MGEIIMFIDLGKSKACKLVRPFFFKSERKVQNKEEYPID